MRDILGYARRIDNQNWDGKWERYAGHIEYLVIDISSCDVTRILHLKQRNVIMRFGQIFHSSRAIDLDLTRAMDVLIPFLYMYLGFESNQ